MQNTNAAPICTAESDKVNVSFCILAWFCPLFALIYFLVKKAEKPKGSKAVGIIGLCSFIFNMVVMIVALAMTGSILNKTFDAIGYTNPGVVIESQWQRDDSSFTENISVTSDSHFDINGELDWKNMTFLIGDAKVNLPCSYAEFSEKTGYTIAENQSDYLDSNQYTLLLTATNAQGREMQIRFYNSEELSKPLQECLVFEISVATWNDNYADVYFPGIIKIGNKFNTESLTRLYGKPSNICYYDSGCTTIRWDDNSDSYSEFKVVSDDGKTVSKISVKVFPWE